MKSIAHGLSEQSGSWVYPDLKHFIPLFMVISLHQHRGRQDGLHVDSLLKQATRVIHKKESLRPNSKVYLNPFFIPLHVLVLTPFA